MADSLQRKQNFKMVPYTALENLHLTVEIFDTTSRKMIETTTVLQFQIVISQKQVSVDITMEFTHKVNQPIFRMM